MKLQLAEEDRPPAELSLDEYLHGSWGPDCDFVDGRTVERNVGTFTHSTVVSFLIWALPGKEKGERSDLLSLPSLRIQVSPMRIRVPDICVVPRSGPHERILTHPPLAVVEVLDEEDPFGAMMERLADFRQFGVQNIWVIDPERRIAYTYNGSALEEVTTGELVVGDTPIRVSLSEMFAELDRA